MSLFRFPVIFSAAALAVGTLLFSCGGKQKTETVAEDVQITPVMTASADSLYNFVEDQVNFGPRTPGSEGHAACVDYIVRSVRMFGADTVMIHEAPVTTYRGDTFTARNIFAQFNPGARRRVLLLAHYDTRPWATEDSDKEARMRPIDGANDGGSGVSVLLEVARNLGLHPLDSVGVDLLFTDVEDSGQSETWGAQEETWCLGTQEWVKDMPYDDTNRPEFGILLDMVGGKDAKFHREYFSQQHAKKYVDKVWAVADASGFGERFINDTGTSCLDDHVYINRAEIPCIDIIENSNPSTYSFNPTWHTLGDNLGAIDSRTMRIVAQVVLNTLYNL